MVSSIMSVVVGYLGMAVIVMFGSALAAAALIPGGLGAAKKMDGPPPRNYLVANLALSFVAALFGGWLCALRAPESPMVHVIVLAALLLGMSIVSSKSYGAKQPPWYPWTIAVVGFGGVIVGGLWQVWRTTT